MLLYPASTKSFMLLLASGKVCLSSRIGTFLISAALGVTREPLSATRVLEPHVCDVAYRFYRFERLPICMPRRVASKAFPVGNCPCGLVGSVSTLSSNIKELPLPTFFR